MIKGKIDKEEKKLKIDKEEKKKMGVGCIDKWVKSKFDNVTPPELCSGPI